MQNARIPLAEAAQELRVRYNRALDLVLTGQLEGHRGPNQRWEVSRASVEAYRARLGR